MCLTCNSKFLYRDAIYELLSRLELRDEEIRLHSAEFLEQERAYDQVVQKITKQKTERAKLNNIINTDRAEMLRVRDDCDQDLIIAKKQKVAVKQQLD